jgi:hypothetical protein
VLTQQYFRDRRWVDDICRGVPTLRGNCFNQSEFLADHHLYGGFHGQELFLAEVVRKDSAELLAGRQIQIMGLQIER